MDRRSFLAAMAALPTMATRAIGAEGVFYADKAVAEAITIARREAYRSSKVNWPALEAKVRAAAVGARDDLDLLPAFAILLEGLGDGHSFVQVSDEQRDAYQARHGHAFDDMVVRHKQASTFILRREQAHRTLDLEAGRRAELITVPKMIGGGAAARAYAQALFGQLAAAAPYVGGFLLDLRGNIGGNIWPMLAGLSPLLGDGFASGEEDAKGVRSVYATLKSGAAVIASGEQAGLEIIHIDGWRDLGVAAAPVAVLIDDGVASSGEGVTLALKGRPHTRFFGQRTYGAASSNEGFLLSGGANLVITVAMMTDRNGRTYPKGIATDVPVVAGPGSTADPDDAAVEAAKAWLKGSVSRHPAASH